MTNIVETSSGLPQWAVTDVSNEVDEGSGRAEVRRLIEEGDSSAAYRDEPSVGTSRYIEASDGQQARTEPSQLQESHNEWQD